MDSFFSKAASSFLSSQAEENQETPKPAPTHFSNQEQDELPKPAATSGGYGELLSGMQSLMQGDEKKKAGGYGELLSGVQSLMQGVEQKKASGGTGSTTEGYGNLLASAQAMMDAAKGKSGGGDQGHTSTLSSGQAELGGDDKWHNNIPSSGQAELGGDGKRHNNIPSSGQADLAASAQVLMKAARERGQVDMGEVAGAAANLVSAASEYGHIKGTSYGEYADKAQAYLRDYQASHSEPGSVHESPFKGAEDEYRSQVTEGDNPLSSKTPSNPAPQQDDYSRE